MLKIQLIRHATLIISINNKKILVDPMLSSKGSLEPIPKVPNENFNPLVELPVPLDAIIDCDAILITHTHRDHFDETAAKLLNKTLPVFCQPEDESKIHSYGFENVYPIDKTYIWDEIVLHRTKGQHGYEEIAAKMAPVSGFVISSAKEQSLYIAGDTVLCDDVTTSIEKFKPEVVVCNCGAAQFEYGKPITMNEKDIHKLCTNYSNIKVIAVHMEAWNHCRLSRNDLKNYIIKNNIKNSVVIPEDGELLKI